MHYIKYQSTPNINNFLNFSQGVLLTLFTQIRNSNPDAGLFLVIKIYNTEHCNRFQV